MLRRYLPILTWGPAYTRAQAGADLIAAVIVTIMLIPQSLAYALLAGLPAEVGLYASILPLVIYALFGTSRVLAVGPVAVASLMTAAAVGQFTQQGTPEYYGAAIALAFLSGLMLLAMGVLRLGFIANFLSHPVISGFISASGILIAASQIPHLLGIRASGHNLPELLHNILGSLGNFSIATAVIPLSAAGFLHWSRTRMKDALIARGIAPRRAGTLARTGPVLAVFATTLVTFALGLEGHGVAIVGAIPSGLPTPTLPPLDPGLWAQIALPAALISIVGYVETISVAQTLAAKRRQRIDPDQELVALGASNLGSAVSGGFPVTGGFARSVVNFDAGAETLSVAHLGDGNIHFTVFPARQDDAVHDEVVEAVEDEVQALGGSFSAEHGVGLSKLPSMRRRKAPVALEVMRAIKLALDPEGRMNPGKVIPAP